jgi:hypothetical protein
METGTLEKTYMLCLGHGMIPVLEPGPQRGAKYFQTRQAAETEAKRLASGCYGLVVTVVALVSKAELRPAETRVTPL